MIEGKTEKKIYIRPAARLFIFFFETTEYKSQSLKPYLLTYQ